ncbi:DegV family protein [Bacillus sp. DTU_2020_1000418_1_SI_GHA_SEK_038]|uniref:DegV family protein n=1 Tax=Bacillus sp. DTU_2020_1000418_1_SI_GHA_SEK_038 TaxID=3077585 RepID=UPI0028ED908B|nr:DegV family protein [Bacillus sp. DTU_2020_1000418_1_SI_GHA_SEK_038]WNS73935.1 DegV family protein [Bacillus sp. DTU_2020_1000418_1_SI_GHA_SEK_038]
MAKIAWVTDSTAYLEKQLLNHPDVYAIPVTILLDEEEFLEVDLTPAQLYERLKTLKNPPKTSQPSIGAFKDLYEKLGEKYDVIFSVHISSKLSGTASSSEQAAQLVDAKVITIDSKVLTYPLTRIVKKGIELAESGMEPEEIKLRLESLRETNETYVRIGSLEQLHRSGRMSGVQFFLGSMLNIIPIIAIVDGALSTNEKVRSDRKAKDKMIQLLRKSHQQKPIKEAYLLYGLHESEAVKWKDELIVEFPEIAFEPYPLGAAIGVHAGENTLGISWFNGLDFD